MTTKHQQDHPVPKPPATPAPAPNAAPAANSPHELEQWKAQAAENWDKFLRAAADLDNYRKRVIRERDEVARQTREQMVTALLPALDIPERAITAGTAHRAKSSALLEGIQQVHAQLKRALEEFGLEEVAAQAGHPFDPNLHEAVGHVESAEHPEGTILDQLQRGYKLTERLLRPARVLVSKGSPAASPSPPAETDADPQ